MCSFPWCTAWQLILHIRLHYISPSLNLRIGYIKINKTLSISKAQAMSSVHLSFTIKSLNLMGTCLTRCFATWWRLGWCQNGNLWWLVFLLDTIWFAWHVSWFFRLWRFWFWFESFCWLSVNIGLDELFHVCHISQFGHSFCILLNDNISVPLNNFIRFGLEVRSQFVLTILLQ